MENTNTGNNKWIVIAIIFLVVGAILGATLVGMRAPQNSQQGASLDAKYADQVEKGEMVTVTLPRKTSLNNKEVLNIASQLNISYDETVSRAGWLCRLFGGNYWTYPDGSTSCLYNSARTTAAGGVIMEEVEIEGVPFSKLSSDEIYRISEERGFSSDPNERPGWFCRILGGTYFTNNGYWYCDIPWFNL